MSLTGSSSSNALQTGITRSRFTFYDVTGGRYEEHSYHAVGSGGFFARGSLKKLYREQLGADDAVTASVQALYDAADDDSAPAATYSFQQIGGQCVAADRRFKPHYYGCGATQPAVHRPSIRYLLVIR